MVDWTVDAWWRRYLDPSGVVLFWLIDFSKIEHRYLYLLFRIEDLDLGRGVTAIFGLLGVPYILECRSDLNQLLVLVVACGLKSYLE